MSRWLEPVAQALAADRAKPLQCFIRDDDGGWEDGRLLTLLDRLRALDVPIDVAVIPTALTPDLVDILRKRKRSAPQRLGVHQHGYRHINHEVEGRKCEFGPGRSLEEQFADIMAGQGLLKRAFGEAFCDPLFTPPWNRCTQQTVVALQRLNFCALSRNKGAQALQLHSLADLPIAFDWQRQRPDRCALAEEFAVKLLAAPSEENASFGIMLHHAVMSADDLQNLTELLQLLLASPLIEFRLMSELLTPHSRHANDGKSVAAK